MSWLDKLFVQEEPKENSIPNVKGGSREEVIDPLIVAQPVQTETESISGNGAKELIKNALAPLEGKEATVYTLRDLIAKLPSGTGKEQILGILDVTGISADEIKADAEERIEILDSKEIQINEKFTAEIAKLDAEIKAAEESIAINRKNKADVEALLRDFASEKSATITEIKNIMASIN